MRTPDGRRLDVLVAPAARWLAGVVVLAGGAGLGLLLAGPALAYAGAVEPLTGLRVFLLAPRVGLPALGLAVVGLGLAWGHRRPRGWILAGGLAGLLAAGIAWGFLAYARRYPPINDIVTTPDAPPVFREAARLPANTGRDLTYPGGPASEAQRRAYPDLAPLRLSRSPAEAFELVERVARTMPGWTITVADPSTRHLEAVAITRVFRFRDDVAVEVRPADRGAAVHVRSKSRIGRGDLGANAARIRELLERIREAAER